MPTNNIIYISGSPRKNSNTDILLKMALEITGGEFIKLSDLMVKPCASCWACQKRNNCIIDDDMTKNLTPLLLNSDGIVLGSPVYFNNVSAQLKNFIDRTWCLKKGLKNKIGGAVVVGRRYGAESTITAINSFFLKHEMIIANRGVSGIAFEAEEILKDEESVKAIAVLAKRINDLCYIINGI